MDNIKILPVSSLPNRMVQTGKPTVIGSFSKEEVNSLRTINKIAEFANNTGALSPEEENVISQYFTEPLQNLTSSEDEIKHTK